MMLPMDLSISSISGHVDVELLAEVVPVLGLVIVDEASLLLLLLVLLEELDPLEDSVSLSVSWPAVWDMGNMSEGSFVVVLLELGYGLADREALGEGDGDGCASLWSGMLSVTTCRRGISKSGSVTLKVNGLLLFLVEGHVVLSVRAGMALILLTGSSLNLVCLVPLLLVAVSETKTLDVSDGFEIFLFGGPEKTVFCTALRIAICSLFGGLLVAERIEFSFELSSSQGSSEGTEFCTCK